MTSAVFLTAAALTLSGATYKAVELRGQSVSRPAVAFAATREGSKPAGFNQTERCPI